MCLGIPGQLVEIIDAEKHIGQVEVSGNRRSIHIGILRPEEAQVGTWVMINAGLAVCTLEADEAAQILRFIEELDQQFEEVQP